MTIGNRIFKLMSELGIRTQAELSEKSGVNTSTLNQYISGNYSPNAKQLAKIAIALDTSIDYLMGLTDNPRPSSKLQEFNGQNSYVLPVVGWASAGRGICCTDEISRYVVVDGVTGYPKESLCCTQVVGDSMSPSILPDDIVVVLFDPAAVVNGDVIIATVENTVFLKRVKFSGMNVMMSSDNLRYSPMLYHRDDVFIAGKVIKVIREMN